MSFIRTGFREVGLKVRRQKSRLALRHEKRLLQKSEINLGREGTSQAANFPELRNEIVALKKLEQEQKEVALRISQIEEGVRKIEAERQQNAREQQETIAKLEAEKKPILQRRNEAKSASDLCDRELSGRDTRRLGQVHGKASCNAMRQIQCTTKEEWRDGSNSGPGRAGQQPAREVPAAAPAVATRMSRAPAQVQALDRRLVVRESRERAQEERLIQADPDH